MKTKIIIHRLQSEASAAYRQETKENILKNKFRMYPAFMSYDVEGVKYIHVSWEELGQAILPRGEDVGIELRCIITEEERLILSREWYIR